jgi:peptide/nickel transport system ATP-binding protein
MSGTPLIELRDVRVSFDTADGAVAALRSLSLELDAGRTIGIVGESGSGKSMLARAIMRLLPPTASPPAPGSILFDGRSYESLSPDEAKHFWGVQVGLVFQDPMRSLTPVMKIGKQLMEPLRLHLGLSRKEARERAIELLRLVGIPDPERRTDEYPHNLSGGMRQRVMIALAMSCSPRLLICDEPTTALDVTVQQQVLNLLATTQASFGMAMILISHDLGVVAGRTDTVAVMYGGAIVEQAPTTQLFVSARHPYSIGLLKSVPTLRDEPHTVRFAIPGRATRVFVDSVGCSFAPRCAWAQERCLAETPRLQSVESESGQHTVACFYPHGSSRAADALAKNRSVGHNVTGLALDGSELEPA